MYKYALQLLAGKGFDEQLVKYVVKYEFKNLEHINNDLDIDNDYEDEPDEQFLKIHIEEFNRIRQIIKSIKFADVSCGLGNFAFEYLHILHEIYKRMGMDLSQDLEHICAKYVFK